MRDGPHLHPSGPPGSGASQSHCAHRGLIKEKDASAEMRKRGDTRTSVWHALADTPEQAAHLSARAVLMRQIAELIEANGWKQIEAAQRCRVTQPRIHTCCSARA